MKFIILTLLLATAYADDRVVGGTEAKEGDIKSLVSLRKDSQQFCGGTLISELWVVSAAHCYYEAGRITVHAGDYNLIVHEESETVQVPKNCIKHEDYKFITLQNDIMMIELSSPITLNEDIHAARMPALGSPLLEAGTKCQVCGWGNILMAGTIYPLKPHCADISVIDKDECNKVLAYGGQILDGMVCIGDMSGGTDSCQGDSGGPVYCNHSGLIGDDEGEFSGVVSWGQGCALPNKPGVYSEVAFFRQWIYDISGV